MSSTSFSPSTAPPSVSSLWSANVTGSSFWVYWSSQVPTSQTYRVVVAKGPDVLRVWDTPESTLAVLGLDPGLLYTVAVTPCACGRQGHPVHVPVRTGESHVITAKRTFSTVVCLCLTLHGVGSGFDLLCCSSIACLVHNYAFHRRRCDSQRLSSPHQHPLHQRPAGPQQPSLQKPNWEHFSRGQFYGTL